jgi:hypothetical protein
MPIQIAEYLGQRTDTDREILPSIRGGRQVPMCPFSGDACIKLNHNPPLQPVCTVRVHDKNYQGEPFIVCSNRLIPAQAQTLTADHMQALRSIASAVLPTASPQEIGFRRQVGIVTGANARLYLDYVLQVHPDSSYDNGPRKIILEIQGGGETSNTGTITRYVEEWTQQENPTNAFLAQLLDTDYLRTYLGENKVNVPGIIPNNAWKRQLDQIIKKSVLAKHFGGGFALVCGDILYDYIQRSIPIQQDFFPEWEVAFIGISEVLSSQPGAIPLTSVSRSTFMTHHDFIQALQNFSLPQDINSPFLGEFTTLTNRQFITTE